MIISVVVHTCYVRMRGIHVCVRNVEPRPLRVDVALSTRTTTRTHPLGTLAQGQGACVWVKPEGESDITVTVTGEAMSKMFELEGYVEPSAHGAKSVEVSTTQMRITDDRIEHF